MMFDFQTLRYASPMLDLVVFLSNSAGVDVRQPNFKKIFTQYHTSLLSSFKKGFGSDEVPEFLRFVLMTPIKKW